jgi:asparagine synthase (glutamine-hydrolysing)
MPGLFGVVNVRRGSQAAAAFAPIFDPAARGFESESLAGIDGWAIGRTHLGVLQPDAQLRDGDSVHVLVHGDVHGPSAASIADSYRESGPAFAEHLEGAFCAAILDTTGRRTLLASDVLGSYPLYWTVADGTLIFSSELRALLRHPDVRRELDAGAVADYLAFGFPLGTKTLAASVTLVPPGCVVVFDWDSGAVTIHHTADIAAAFTPWDGTRESYGDALSETFRAAVDRALSGPHAFGISLSGGLDSRAILSTLNGHADAVGTYTLGVRGCADQVIAERLARLAGTRHTFFEFDDRYLREFVPNLRRMVSLTDGMYLSHGLTEILALDFIATTPFSVLLRGHGGELAKTDLAWPLHTDDRVRTLTSRAQLAAYLLRRVNYISAHLKVRDLFTDEWADRIDGRAAQSLEEATAGVALAPADLCSYLYLKEQHRRFTVSSLELFRQAVEVRLPFVDRAFLDVLFRGKPEWRAGTDIHRALTAAGKAAMLRVRNSNTGAPADAGPRLEFALDKVNSLFKRIGVPGYRHYHNFAGWMREQLLSSVETVLLCRESLDRGILRESGLRRLLDDTRAGRADHSYLIQVLLILELWQQENL